MSTSVKVRIAHASMQFSDSPKQKEHDVNVLFERALNRDYCWITGTEAGEQPLRGLLRGAAKEAGFKFFEYKSNWIAVDREIILPGTYKAKGSTIIENDLVAGPGHDSNIVRARFKMHEVGTVNVLCSHYPTKGRPNVKNPEYSRNLKWTRKLAEAIGAKTEKVGAGKALVFYGGDQNIVDRFADTFFGQPLTSAWDELKEWDNTGHGNIDVIASFDRDKRVKAKQVEAYPDKKVFLNTDHYLIEAVYEIQKLKKAA